MSKRKYIYAICTVSLLIGLSVSGCKIDSASNSIDHNIGKSILPLVVQTQSGQVEGLRNANGTRSWLGIPYARAPEGPYRWKPPHPPKKWRGMLYADRFGAECMQPLRHRLTNHYYGPQTTSEDCLFLNIWAPREPAEDGKPYAVIYWIYGGAFQVGSTNTPLYSGENLAAKNVIFVSVSYRIGALGFMAHPELSNETTSGASGNYGLQDQILGLEWVQDNIKSFGGDPNRVTIMGQSAGSASVSFLQQSPLAKGLFHRAVGFSASTFGAAMRALPLKTAQKQGEKFQAILGAKNLDEMRNMPADKIVQAQTKFSPIIDGHTLTYFPRDSFKFRAQNDIPIMIGFTKDESFSPFGKIKTYQEYRQQIHQTYGDFADQILLLYPANDDETARQSAHLLANDESLSLNMMDWADLQNEYGDQPVFVYRFSKQHPYERGIKFSDHNPETAGAYHTGDLPYWILTQEALNKQRHTRNWGGGDYALAEIMSGALVSFANVGKPTIDGISVWPKYTGKDQKIIEFGSSVSEQVWPSVEKVKMLRRIRTKIELKTALRLRNKGASD